jgi:hypothetical protein
MTRHAPGGRNQRPATEVNACACEIVKEHDPLLNSSAEQKQEAFCFRRGFAVQKKRKKLSKMAATGVAVSDEVISQFNDVKLGRVQAKYMIYKIENGMIVTETTSNDQSFENFVNSLPTDDCRYAIYDMNFTTTDGRPGNKLVSIAW